MKKSFEYSHPLVTIAICTKNRPTKLSNTLASLINKIIASSHKLSILIIDSSSDKKTNFIVNKFRNEYSGLLNIYYYHQITNGISFARNLAIKLTLSQFLCFIDDDVYIGQSWLSAINHFAANNKTAEIGFGPIFPLIENQSHCIPKLNDVLSFTPWIFTVNTCGNTKPHPFTANVIINKRVFNKIGPFNTVFACTDKKHYHPYGEDPEFFQRAKDNGILFCFISNMTVEHVVGIERLSLAYLAGRYYDDGKNKVLFRFYSKNYDHSIKNFIKLQLSSLENLIKLPKGNYLVRTTYLLSELAGHFVMSFTLLINLKYYKSKKTLA